MNEMALFNSIFGDGGYAPVFRNYHSAPKVDVIQKKDSYVICMDLPGKTENDVEITLKNDLLTIKSAENAEKNAEDDKTVYLLNERQNPDFGFKRSFTLPKDIDGENVTASFVNGVLSVVIGRKEGAQERRITVSAA